MARSSRKRVSKSQRGQSRGGKNQSRKTANRSSTKEDDVFAQLLTDEDARAARGRLKEPDAIFWDFWN